MTRAETADAAPQVSLSTQAYLTLRDRLVSLHYAPMEPLNERALSEELGIGLTPIREALRRLQHEKLVEIYPRRGTFASGIGLNDQQLIQEIRLELEALAARLVCERATMAERDHLAAFAANVGGTRKERIDKDARFHREFYRLTHNRFLETALNQHYNLALKVWYLCVQSLSPDQEIRVDHSELAQAIIDNDPEAAVEAARHHIVSSAERVRSLMSGGPRSRPL